METRLLCLLHALRFGSYTVNQLCIYVICFLQGLYLYSLHPPPPPHVYASYIQLVPRPNPPKERRFVEKSGGIFVITISLTIVDTGLLTTSTHHTPTDLFITLPIYWSPASNFKGFTSVTFAINYVPYSLAAGLPFGISYVLYVWRHAMSTFLFPL